MCVCACVCVCLSLRTFQDHSEYLHSDKGYKIVLRIVNRMHFEFIVGLTHNSRNEHPRITNLKA